MAETITSLARGISADTTILHSPPFSDYDDFEPPYHADEAAALVSKRRMEFYALTGIITRNVVDKFVGKREDEAPYGLSEIPLSARITIRGRPPSGVKGAEHFERLLVWNLRLATKETLADMESSESALVVKRARQLIPIFKNQFPGLDPRGKLYKSLDTLIKAGGGTAGVEMISALYSITVHARAKYPTATDSEIAQIARNSSMLTKKMAGVNFDRLGAVSYLLRRDGHSNADEKSAIGLKQQNGDGLEKVDFTRPLLDMPNPQTDDGSKIGDIKVKHATLGCPVLPKINGESAMDKLWADFVNLAENSGLIGVFLDPSRKKKMKRRLSPHFQRTRSIAGRLAIKRNIDSDGSDQLAA